MTKTIILIPSRLAATRLPNKPLLKINGLSIINHVYNRAQSVNIGEVFVATGDKEIFDEVTKAGGNCILTKKNHQTGTDRIYEAYEQLDLKNIDYIINLQGDEPIIGIDDVRNLNKNAIINKSNIATLACEIIDKNKLNKKNIVKVYTDKQLSSKNISKAITFSRENLSNYKSNIYHHIGIYIYKVSILKKFVNLKQSENEVDQKLEQLRAIENKINIDVILANNSPIGVDTEEDFVELKKIMNYKN
tara:strand:- start:106 stop:846 length:741 start_codon:yes stop_codon:yes gene_type:complete